MDTTLLLLWQQRGTDQHHLGMARVLDPSPVTTPTPSSVGPPPLTDGRMASPSTGSLLIATTRAQAPENPQMTGDCQPPDTA